METAREFLLILLDPRGRIGRAGFWQAILVFFGLFLIAAALIAGAALLRGYTTQRVELGWWTVLFLIPTAFKRLHDRGKSAWWLLVFFVVPVLMAFTETNQGGAWRSALSCVESALWIWGLVELALLKGTTGSNVYGPRPE